MFLGGIITSGMFLKEIRTLRRGVQRTGVVEEYCTLIKHSGSRHYFNLPQHQRGGDFDQSNVKTWQSSLRLLVNVITTML